MIQRLRENLEMLKMYDDVIKDQLNKGLIESIDDNSIQEKLKHYIPHHAVVTPNKIQRCFESCMMPSPRPRRAM